MSLFNTNETYQILENPICQTEIKLADALDNTVDKIISIASTGISLKRDILTTAVETIISPLAITDINTGNSISMANLTYLPIGLASLEPPPNATTLHINNTLLVSNTPTNSNTITIDANAPSITLNNSAVAPYISVGSLLDPNALYINGNTGNIEVDCNAGNIVMGDTNGVNHFTKFTLNDNHYNIDLDCINLTANSDSYTYPICFTYRASGSVSYGSPSSFQDVFHQNVPFPSFVMSPDTLPQYATWKIEFALNCRNMTDQANKELAIYFELEDTNTAIYTPFLFNNGTPYTNHKNGSTYPGTPASENYTWSDYVDLNGVNGAVPLLLRLYWYAQSSNNFDFNLVVSFTKTNVLT